MADRISKLKRSANMIKIRSKNTKPELKIRKILHKAGFRFRLYQKNLPGTPDLVLKKWNKVIFINGCFWHQHNCKYTYYPASNLKYWKPKLEKNIIRFNANVKILKKLNWHVITIWECQINKWTDERIANYLKSKITDKKI